MKVHPTETEECSMAHKTTIATKEKNERLYRAILALETEEECYAFFQDLCTIAELRSMEQRYEVATLLSEGMVYSDILERTGASSATISRVNRALLNGTGGYVSVLGKMKEDGHEQL
jgi:TrpR-related protein YerC/YecD